jgi:glycosyltransferase involved in cell wall biosynthesis
LKKTRILFVCNEFPPYPHGGIGVFVNNLSADLSFLDFECVVVGLYPGDTIFEEYIGNVRVIRLNDPTNLKFDKLLLFSILQDFRRKLRLSLFIRNLEREKKFDLIESYEWNGPLAFKPKTKLLIRLHGSNTAYSAYEGKPFSRLIRFHESKNLGFADNIVSVSNHMWSLTQKTFAEMQIQKRIVYNSYNSAIFHDVGVNLRDSNKILFVGKFHERKGVFELFKILNVLFGKSLDYEFAFVGPYRDKDYDEIITFINPDFRRRIKFIGPLSQSDLARRYLESSLMIMPSRAEAFGLTAIEAMSCGCIVAMSNLPVAHEIIDDNIDGIIINPTSTEETAERIHSLLSNKNLIQRIRENAIIKATTKFSSVEILKQNVIMYKEIVK